MSTYGKLRLCNESDKPIDIVLTAMTSDHNTEVLRPGDEVVMDIKPGESSQPITIGASKEREG